MSEFLIKLADRSLHYIEGRNLVNLLQPITTSDIELFASSSFTACSTLFLNNNGKIEYDAILAKVPSFTAQNPIFFLDSNCCQIESLSKHLKSTGPITIESLNGVLDIYSTIASGAFPVIPEGTKQVWEETGEASLYDEDQQRELQPYTSFIDPRTNTLGTRTYSLPDTFELSDEVQVADTATYNLLRMLAGVPQGRPVEGLNPYYANFQLLHSIADSKSDYTGKSALHKYSLRETGRTYLLPFIANIEDKDFVTHNANQIKLLDTSFTQDLVSQKFYDELGNEVGLVLEQLFNIGLVLTRGHRIQTEYIMTEDKTRVIVWQPLWLGEGTDSLSS